MNIVFGSTDGDHYPSFSFYFEGPSSDTCQGNCEHCYLRQAVGNQIPLKTCFEQYNDLITRSYTIVPKVPDTFSREGEYLRQGILKNNHLYAQEKVKDCGIAWTSGLPLLRGNGDYLLNLARDSNLNVIALTGHALTGLVQGVIPASVTEAAIRLVQEWNRQHPPEHTFKISITFTISHLNKDLDFIESYIKYARKFGADFIRINRFIDCTEDQRFHHLIMSQEETGQFFADIAHILSCYDSPTLMVSSDFGFTGIGAIGGHEGQNNCAGGTGSFAIFNSLVFPCDEILTKPIGKLIYNLDDGYGWDIELKPGVLEALADAKCHSNYHGCIAHLFSSTAITVPK
jgi:hypothetical protein